MGTAAPGELDTAYRALQAFGHSRFACQLMPVTGGFSGAKVFQVKVRENEFALKQWPSGQPTHTPLVTIHHWMEQARSNGISVIPSVQRTVTQQSSHLMDGHAWELHSWMPGQPVNDPTDEQLQQAIQQLHRLHQIWRRLHQPIKAPCPAVLLQYQRLTKWRTEEWEQLKRSDNSVASQAAMLLQSLVPQAICTLQPWLNRKVLVQPCLADVWADHLLFQKNMLTGLIDFGGARLDHPSQDLARLISSWSLTASRPLDHCLMQYPDQGETLQTLSRMLAQTGLIVSLSNWLRWLFLERRPFADVERCLQRMQQIYVLLCNHHHKLPG